MPSATNLILYGPPGTGKTYRTAWEAVRLCLGEQAAALQGGENRAELTAQYRRLVREGRIEFVTFHQSMSYEEFVEGLRPTTDTGPDDVGGAGFRLEPVPGIFQRIARRAEARRSALPGGVAEDARQNEDEQDAPWMSLNSPAEPSASQLSEDAANLHPTEQLYTVGELSDVRWGSFRWLTQEVIRQLVDLHPQGFTLAQLRDALVKAGDEKGAVPNGGWESHNMPNWAAHPNQGWLVKIDPDDGAHADGAALRHTNASASHAATTIDSYVLIIDEINRANISKVFGELITLLEPDKRLGMEHEIRLTLPYSKKPFGVPANLHIIGTMNTADRSIALLDTALRRRFTFRELMPDPSVLGTDVDGIDLRKLLTTINERIEYLFDREHQIGHAYFTACETRADVEAVMRHKIIPLLAEYFYEDWSKVAAVLGDTRQDKPRFLIREDITAPDGIDADSFAAPRQRWRVSPERGGAGGDFDFSEFAA